MIHLFNSLGKIRFVDGNSPGIVYVGTSDHFKGLQREGGCPFVIRHTRPIVDNGVLWEEREAPAFWAEPDPSFDGEE